MTLVLGLPNSVASHANVRDGNDTRGPLDIESVRMSDGIRPAWTITTWGSWRAGDIWDSGFLVLKMDTFGDSHFDYYALIRSTGSRLVGTLHRDYKRKQDVRRSALRVNRPDRSSARVRVPLDKMNFEQEGVFRWMTTASWSSSRCSGATCLDRAPDSGAINEPRRPVPTPTLTATPTESP